MTPETWEHCKSCEFMINKLRVVQHRDAGHWNYCPNCGEEWEYNEVEA